MATSGRMLRRVFVAAVLAGAVLAMVPIIASAEQPEMNEAIGHLKEARESLAHASKDKGGHREKAMSLIDQAIEEVKAGKAYAKEHPEKPAAH
jgi:hypothetical protein